LWGQDPHGDHGLGS